MSRKRLLSNQPETLEGDENPAEEDGESGGEGDELDGETGVMFGELWT